MPYDPKFEDLSREGLKELFAWAKALETHDTTRQELEASNSLYSCSVVPTVGVFGLTQEDYLSLSLLDLEPFLTS